RVDGGGEEEAPGQIGSREPGMRRRGDHEAPARQRFRQIGGLLRPAAGAVHEDDEREAAAADLRVPQAERVRRAGVRDRGIPDDRVERARRAGDRGRDEGAGRGADGKGSTGGPHGGKHRQDEYPARRRPLHGSASCETLNVASSGRSLDDRPTRTTSDDGSLGQAEATPSHHTHAYYGAL